MVSYRNQLLYKLSVSTFSCLPTSPKFYRHHQVSEDQPQLTFISKAHETSEHTNDRTYILLNVLRKLKAEKFIHFPNNAYVISGKADLEPKGRNFSVSASGGGAEVVVQLQLADGSRHVTQSLHDLFIFSV